MLTRCNCWDLKFCWNCASLARIKLTKMNFINFLLDCFYIFFFSIIHHRFGKWTQTCYRVLDSDKIVAFLMWCNEVTGVNNCNQWEKMLQIKYNLRTICFSSLCMFSLSFQSYHRIVTQNWIETTSFVIGQHQLLFYLFIARECISNWMKLFV